VGLLASLSVEARDELRAFVAEILRDTLAARERAQARREWLTTSEAAELLATTDNAIRCRLRRGWLAGDVARDGKRLFIRHAAVLDELERRASR
jgi:hypothetical protein